MLLHLATTEMGHLDLVAEGHMVHLNRLDREVLMVEEMEVEAEVILILEEEVVEMMIQIYSKADVRVCTKVASLG